MLIPTSYKRKIPHTLSYPIGAEAISLAFRDVPQFKRFTLDFYLSKFVRPDMRPSYIVFQVSYARAPKSLTSGEFDRKYGRQEPRWKITVRPVPRNRRHLIKTKLEDEILPMVRTWLLENGDRDEIGNADLVISFDEEKELISIEKEAKLSPREVSKSQQDTASEQ